MTADVDGMVTLGRDSRQFVRRYSTSLAGLWTQYITAADANLRVNDVAIDSEGAAYVIGSVRDEVTVGPSGLLTIDVACCSWQWVAKVEATGSTSWLIDGKDWFGSDNAGYGNVIATFGDRVFVSGQSGRPVAGNTSYIGFAAELGSASSLAWASSFGAHNTAPLAILPGAQATVIAVNLQSNSTIGGVPITLENVSETVFVVFNSAGSVTRVIRDSTARGRAARVGDTFYYYRDADGVQPAALVARSITGEEQWATAVDQEVLHVVTDGENIFLIGTVEQAALTVGGIAVPARQTALDVFVAGVGLDGAARFVSLIGGHASEHVTGAAASPDGRLYISGAFWDGPLTIHSTEFRESGAAKPFIMTMLSSDLLGGAP